RSPRAAAREGIESPLRDLSRACVHAPGFLEAASAVRAQGGDWTGALAAQAAPFVCHPPHRARRGPAGDPGDARACGPVHDADLHARRPRQAQSGLRQEPSAKLIRVPPYRSPPDVRSKALGRRRFEAIEDRGALSGPGYLCAVRRRAASQLLEVIESPGARTHRASASSPGGAARLRGWFPIRARCARASIPLARKRLLPRSERRRPCSPAELRPARRGGSWPVWTRW